MASTYELVGKEEVFLLTTEHSTLQEATELLPILFHLAGYFPVLLATCQQGDIPFPVWNGKAIHTSKTFQQLLHQKQDSSEMQGHREPGWTLRKQISSLPPRLLLPMWGHKLRQ